MMEPLPFGRYLLVDKIATGGMAEIYLAKLKGIEGFEKTLVIKRILPHWSSNKEFVSMLIDEAKIVVQLNHANIVQVMELGREQETYYISMEYVDGIDLRRLTTTVQQKKARLPEALAVYIASEFLKGLVYAHQKTDESGRTLGLVHRDISPQNILISFTGEVKITDFGIAKAAVRSTETVTGALKGKFAYMSPEQAQGEAVDARTDIFAAGIILYELLTGHRLFGGGRSDIDTLDQVRSADVRFTEEEETRLASPLRHIVLSALKKDLRERYQTTRDFLNDLTQFATHEWGTKNNEDLQNYLESILTPEIAERKKFLMRVSDRTQALPEHSPSGDDPTDPLGTETLHPRGEDSLSSGFSFLQVPQSEEILVSRLVSIPGIKKTIARNLKDTKVMAIATLLLAATGIGWYLIKPGEPIKTLLPTQAEVTTPQAAEPEKVATITPVPGKIVSPEPAPQAPAIDTSLPGSLEVQASPWGLVSVDGSRKLETPLRSMNLNPGQHTVGVTFPPYNKTVNQEVTIATKHHTVCAAKFTKGGSLLKCD